jgi:hypothetical protein
MSRGGCCCKLDTVAEHGGTAALAVGWDLVSFNDPATFGLDDGRGQLGAPGVYAKDETHSR